MALHRDLWRAFRYAGFLIKDTTCRNKRAMLLAYLRLKVKEVLWVRPFRRRITRERFLGFTVHFFNYSEFVGLFEEIFLKREYFFHSDAHKPVVFDCGSNIGMAVLFFKSICPQAAITAFEPDPDTFKLLEKNVRENNLADVTVHNLALAAKAGTISFFVDPTQAGSLWMSTRRENFDADGMPATAREVNAVTLSQYITEPIDFLKMDIEGSENEVIAEVHRQGKLGLIREAVIEYHHHITPTSDQLGSVLRLLEEGGFGYQFSTFLRGPFTPRQRQHLILFAYKN